MLLTVPSALHARAPAPVARIIKLIAADNDFVEAAKKVAVSRFAARRAIDRWVTTAGLGGLAVPRRPRSGARCWRFDQELVRLAGVTRHRYLGRHLYRVMENTTPLTT